MNFNSTGNGFLPSLAMADVTEPIEKTVKKATIISFLLMNILFMGVIFLSVTDSCLKKIPGSQALYKGKQKGK
jgi:hypothetical protein